MALAPARLLLPVRAVEPAHPATLSSASVCSAAAAYPHFSLFFFHPPRHKGRRSSVSVTARVLEVEGNSARRQYQGINAQFSRFDRDQDEEVNFDDLQSLYEEERGNVPYPNRNFNAWPQFGQKSGRGANWEGGHREAKFLSPRHSHRGPEGDLKMRDAQPRSSHARKVPSWTLQTGDEDGKAFKGTWQRSFAPIEDRKARNSSRWGEEREIRNPSWQGGQKETRNSPRQNGQRDGQSNSLWQDGQRDARNLPWQGGHRETTDPPWESEYKGKRNPTSWRPQRQFHGEAEREHKMWHAPPWNSRSSNAPSLHSGTRSRQFHRALEEEVFDHGAQSKDIWQRSYPTGDRSAKPQVSKDLWPQFQSNQHVAPWEKIHSGKIEEGDEYEEAKAGREEELGQNRNAGTEDSAITRIMEKLHSIKESSAGHLGSHAADSLSLPRANEYLSDRSIPHQPVTESEKGNLDTRFPWEIEEAKEELTVEGERRVRSLTLAELTIPAPELKRLRILSIHLKQRVKIGKHGVSTDLVSSIKERWRTCEVVKVKCEGPPAGNMKKTLETLEQKTGGLVIWKAGSVAVLYRGRDFGQPVAEIVDDLLTKKLERLMSLDRRESPSGASEGDSTYKDGTLHELNEPVVGQEENASIQNNVKSSRPDYNKIEEYAKEVEDILTDLGPRYEDWTGPKPVPVDADLLPAIIPNYSPPFRLLPFGVKRNLSGILTTHLRRLSRPLAPHFVTGRDRNLQGLAAAMVKLWEKSEIAKIGVKRGVLNTNQERIAEDIKQLTGGFLLCRDKNSMTFFRGKDFLPQEVAAALTEREALAQVLQDEEERGRADRSIMVQRDTATFEVKPSWVQLMDPDEQVRLKKEADKARRIQVVQHLERKIKMALRKKEKAGHELDKVEELLKPVGRPTDRETITEEERFMFRKLGLKMKAFLLIGRRGVFSGVVQNMHLHWKHRELVKIIIKEKDPVRLKETAAMLEYESGGILVAVEPTSKGQAIVVYRGKNYARPPQLRPPNLLTKRLALKRSLEIQRRLSLSRHIQALEEEIIHLRAGLSKMNRDKVASGELGVPNEDFADGYGSSKNGGLLWNQPTLSEDSVVEDSLLQKQQGGAPTFTEESVVKSSLSEDDVEMVSPKISKRKLRRLCEMGPVFRAERLSKRERHDFRNEIQDLSKAAQFLVGSSNPLSRVAEAIRIYFLDHAFVKIGLRGRPPGTSVQDIAEELEDLTGGTLYAQDVIRIILYRGWPSGEEMPTSDIYDVLSPEQCDVLEEEEEEEEDEDDLDDELVDDTLVENTGTASDYENGKKVDAEDDYSMDEMDPEQDSCSDDPEEGEDEDEYAEGMYLDLELDEDV